jgi:hypothetical protein
MNTQTFTPQPAEGEPNLAEGESIKQYGNKRDVAAMLKMHVRSVDNFIAQGCPHLKLSARAVRFDLDEVRAWLRDRFQTRRLNP